MRATCLALIAIGCGTPMTALQPQALVAIDTDAPTPRLIDRMHVEVLDASLKLACKDCSHEFAFDEITKWPVDFGVPRPSDGSARFVRALLYLSGRADNGVPRPDTAIEQIARIPFTDGVVRVRVDLGLDCVGRPSVLSARTTCVDADYTSEPIAAARLDDGSPSRVGAWHREVAHGCVSHLRAGEVCVPGGVYWMGDARVAAFGAGHDATPEHPVAISPFFMDIDEYTMARGSLWRVRRTCTPTSCQACGNTGFKSTRSRHHGAVDLFD